jgi:hypothetical protein
MSMLVITAQSASMVLTASRRPPRPTQDHWSSGPATAGVIASVNPKYVRLDLARRLDASKCGQRLTGALRRRPAAFLEVHQVRLGEQAHPVAGGERDRLEHGAGRALAVGAADDDDRRRRIEGQAEARLDRSDPIERQLDRLRMQPLAVGEPVG